MSTPIGFITIDIPYYVGEPSGKTINQNVLHDFEYTPYTGHTTFSYIGITGSRLDEKKKYGSSTYTGVTTGITSGVTWTGYTFTYTGKTGTTTSVYYRDYQDGYTMITGNTTGFTKEEVFQQALTRNEHFLGFVEQPRVYSDIFVDRGKLGVVEKNLRLGEIDNIGELGVYGNEYFKIRKQ
jgi:hypothetical protein